MGRINLFYSKLQHSGEKMWITEIHPAGTDPAVPELLNSSPHHPLLTAAQPSLDYAFYDMAVLVLTLN